LFRNFQQRSQTAKVAKSAVKQIVKAMKKEKKAMRKQKYLPRREKRNYAWLFKHACKTKELNIMSIRDVAASTSSCPLHMDSILQHLNVLRGYLSC